MGSKTASMISVGDWLVAIDSDSDGICDTYRHIHHDRDVVADTNPIGTVLMYASITPPVGYLLCDGSTIPQDALYNTLRSMIGTHVPNLTDQFVRGARTQSEINGFTRHNDTTRLPRQHNFSGTTNTEPAHRHTAYYRDPATSGGPYNGIGGGSGWFNYWSKATDPGGAHSHSVTITGGGDSETAGKHVRLAMIIKAHN